ncbi:MAG: nuclease A inhibitor family protein [Spirosomaceae bacterium]|nr:nuclease A inhibitor family protein [Spirosomataceae bacterium]
MENKQTENLSSPNSIESSVKTQSEEEVTSLLENLLYPSESDEPVVWFSFESNLPSPLTVSDLKFYEGHAPDLRGEEVSIDDFWSPLITVEDWYEEYENEKVQNALKVKQQVENLLTHIQAFRVGQIEVDLYLVGQLAENQWGGLKTKVIET